MTPLPLGEAVGSFLQAVTTPLGTLSRRAPDAFTADVVIEAAAIVAGVLAADGRLADSELDGYLDCLGPLLEPPLLISAVALRASGMLRGKERWLLSASVLFDLLARADVKHGTRAAHDYYEHALRLAHVAAALDLVPSPDELAAIDGFRSVMLRHMDDVGLPRPGHPAVRTGPGVPAVAGASTGPEASGTSPSPAEPARPLVDLLAELDALVGLTNVKAEVRRLSSMLQVQQLRAERGLPVIETSHHLVFTGNPGTGKTTVARLLSQIYRTIGVVSKGQLVETDRSKLVAGFVGQTALKTREALESALGGMLLIDEAYALARGGDDDFGREAIDTLVKFMEDHRDDLAIVAAGYPEEMAELIDANPGLKSRFTRTISFADYTDDELVDIFCALGDRNQYVCSEDALARVRHLVASEPRSRGFGNARFVRNLFETAVSHQAMRLAPLSDPSNEELTTLTAADIAPVDS